MAGASCGLSDALLGRVDPRLPRFGRVADRDAPAAAHERCPEQARLRQRALEQALRRVARDAEAERLEARAVAIDERRGAELLGEAPELAARGRALVQVYEVHGDAALLEEALRLARVLAVVEAEDLGLNGAHGIDAPGWAASDASRLCRSRQALSGTGCRPGCRAPPTLGPWKSEPPVATRPRCLHISRYADVWPAECSG